MLLASDDRSIARNTADPAGTRPCHLDLGTRRSKLATKTWRTPAVTGKPACVRWPRQKMAVPGGGASTSDGGYDLAAVASEPIVASDLQHAHACSDRLSVPH
jgi:hypothetical protein